MRESALPYLACPRCHAELELSARGELAGDGHLMSGGLRCVGCSAGYPVTSGVPDLRVDVSPLKAQTAQRFAEEWKRWNETRDYYQQQFLGWLAPLGPADFAGKVVFEGGCGKGRHSELLARFGVKAAVCIDLGESAFVAFENCRALPAVHVVLGDLLNAPVKPVFDLAFSVGVLHHLPDPSEGFKALAGWVKPGGKVAFWVYGQENNEWITRFVDPVRKAVTSRLPSELLKLALVPPSALLWGGIQTIYRSERLGSLMRLPYQHYFGAMRSFPFDEIHSIVFDQLVTPVAHYLPEREVRGWLSTGFDDVVLRWHGEYSWTGLATKPGAQA